MAFSTFFKSEFWNKEFKIWAIVSSQSYFCWLYRASPSSAAKNVINWILILVIWWCPCVESSPVLLEKVVCCDQCILSQNSGILCLGIICVPRPNFPGTPHISWFSTFLFQSPMMKRTSFFGLSSRRLCRSSYNHSTSEYVSFCNLAKHTWLVFVKICDR